MEKMRSKEYNMSFSTGALLKRESLLISSILSKTDDWNITKQYTLENNILQSRTASTLQKLYGEVASRLLFLTSSELNMLNTSSEHDQCYILWISICKKYKFIAEFAHEVVREKFLSLQSVVSFEDYSAFLNAKANCAPELDSLSQGTQKKLRQILFRMLREANLLSNDNHIIPVVPSQRMEFFFKNENNFLYFPMHTVNGWSK